MGVDIRTDSSNEQRKEMPIVSSKYMISSTIANIEAANLQNLF